MNVPYISQWKLMKQVVVPFSKCSQCKWCSWSLLVKCQPFSWWQDVRQPLKSHRGRIVHLWELFLLSSNRSRSLWLNRKKRPKMAQYDLVGGFFFRIVGLLSLKKTVTHFVRNPIFDVLLYLQQQVGSFGIILFFQSGMAFFGLCWI